VTGPIDRPVQERPVERLLAPLRNFLRTEASGGILLLGAAVVALVWANSPFSDSYGTLWGTPVTLGLGGAEFTRSLHFWINDGLMAIFFFVVGLEIKRELLIGELASVRRALLPIGAAAGGAIAPAVIFLAITRGGEGSAGWGVPMATDIAFALGVLVVLGSRVPLGLKIFVTALAIADDLMAILVIAVFYAEDLSLPALGASAAIFAMLVAANRLDVRSHFAYALLGVALWIGILSSGVHATIAGVLLAVTVPASTRLDGPRFVTRARQLIESFAGAARDDVRRSDEWQSALTDLEDATEGIQTPLQRLEHNLHPFVAYLIVPLFGLANAGVSLGAGISAAVTSPVAYGVVIGLILGKQLGILGVAAGLVRLGWAELPSGVTWRHMWGGAWVAGIGFTMSLFIGELAYAESPLLLEVAKVGILIASVIAATGGWIVMRSAAASRT
jgi:NhaA family Na+:H+ antiporter